MVKVSKWKKYCNSTRATQFVKANSFKWHCFFRFSNYLLAQKWLCHINLGICMNRFTKIQSSIFKKSVQSYRGEIQLSSMMASVYVCTESNQKEYKASLSLMAAERLPEAHPFQENSCVKEQMWAQCEGRAPAIFAMWRLQHVQGQNTLMNKLFCVHVYSVLSIYAYEWNDNYVRKIT